MDEVYGNNTGISKKYILNIFNHFVLNKPYDDQYQKQYEAGYLGYGVGFQIISQPIQSIVNNILNYDNSLSDEAKLILSKRIVFLFFLF